jgi:UDP-N-acetylglucosamine pyrophosphorylase
MRMVTTMQKPKLIKCTNNTTVRLNPEREMVLPSKKLADWNVKNVTTNSLNIIDKPFGLITRILYILSL